MENLLKIRVYMSHLIFLKELSRFLKIAFSLERVYGRIFLTEFGGTFFAGLFPGLFSLAKEKIHREKNPAETQVNENSSKVRRNTSLQERWKSYAKRRQSQTYT